MSVGRVLLIRRSWGIVIGKLFSNIPQMPSMLKYGRCQSSSFTIKKIPEIDVVCSELSQSIQLIKDLKCEKLFDFFGSTKFQITLRAGEWSSVEDVIHKLTKGKRKEINSLHTKCKEAVASLSPFIESKKFSETISASEIGDSPSDLVSPDPHPIDQPTFKPLNNSQESKKSPYIISQFISFKNVSNQNVFKSGLLYVSPTGGVHINGNGRIPYQGQRRGFKTKRMINLEVNEDLLKKFSGLFGDVPANSQKESMQATKDGSSNSSSPEPHLMQRSLSFIKYVTALLTLCLVASCIYLIYEFFYNSSVNKFSAIYTAEKVNVTFDDVKGMDEAKESLQSVVQFLRDPSKFDYLGGKLPTGILLQGPPGTGKTLLARAVAGEANVKFFHINGSEFDEVLVGEGARRVRNLFQTARSQAPAVIFIDEIDAVGGKRVSNSLHPFANQTVIQLLSEMDGFVRNDKICIIGATNRAFDLDEALLRPGRFDLKIQLNLPDFQGRKEILTLHLRKIICKDIDVDYIALRTVGFTGADLENILNQAALAAATSGSKYVTTEDIDKALENVLLGPPLKSRIRTEEANRMTAYHESGHVIAAYFTPGSSPPIKASIAPRSKILGHTVMLVEDNVAHTKAQLLAMLDVKLAGRAAEELIYGPDGVTTGCQNDLMNATALANQMVCSFGMSDKFGLRFVAVPLRNPGDKGTPQAGGEEVDREVKRIIQESYERVMALLKKYSREHTILAERLLAKETLEADEINEILSQATR